MKKFIVIGGFGGSGKNTQSKFIFETYKNKLKDKNKIEEKNELKGRNKNNETIDEIIFN